MTYRPIRTGTWTPDVVDSSFNSSEGQTYGSQNGVWRREGDLVHVWCDFFLTSAGTMTGGDAAYIRGLPFDSNGSYAAFTCGHATGMAITASEGVTAYIPSAVVDYIALQLFDATTGSTALTITELSTSSRLVLYGSYITDDP